MAIATGHKVKDLGSGCEDSHVPELPIYRTPFMFTLNHNRNEQHMWYEYTMSIRDGRNQSGPPDPLDLARYLGRVQDLGQ